MIKLSKLSCNVALAMLTGGVIGVSSLAYALSNDEDNVIRNGQVATKPMNVAGLYVPPSVMLVLGREHNLFAEAYDDASDIDGDGYLDTMYDPSIAYEGIFDPNLCYEYSTDKKALSKTVSNDIIDGYWIPKVKASQVTKTFEKLWHAETKRGAKRTVPVCNQDDSHPTNYWLGNFLNYVTTSRIDAIRKILYGGTRLTDTDLTSTKSKPVHYKGTTSNGKEYRAAILKHSRVLRDSHAWGKVLGNASYNSSTKADGEQVFTVKDFTGLSTSAKNDKYGAYFFGLGSYDKNSTKGVGQGRFMRVIYSPNAGMPGVDHDGSINIWDWVSRETADEKKGAVGTSADISKDSEPWPQLPSDGGLSLIGNNIAEGSVAVVVCTPEFYSETDCKNYKQDRSNPEWQPVGLLQQYGEGSSPRIKFGLITGSWKNNLGTGTLRANLGDFADEVYTSEPDNPNEYRQGDFKYDAISCAGGANCGFIKSIDNMNIAQKYGGVQHDYYSCGRSISTDNNIRRIAGINNNTCHDWGNPVAKLLYTAVLYFRNEHIDEYTDDSFGERLKIGRVKQKDPYSLVDYCSKPVTLLIADENISFDYANAFGGTQPFGTNTTKIKTELENVVSKKGFTAGEYIVGGNATTEETDQYYYIPSLKQINNLGEIEGIAPSAAYSHGSYNVAGVASYYSRTVMREVSSPTNSADKPTKHSMQTYVVAMKPNLPEINISVGGQLVTILPFAKTMGDVEGKCGINDPNTDKQMTVRQCQSTNQIADFYVQKITPTSGVFRINYEDFQYGSDYDMDWVVEYDYEAIQGDDGYYIRVVTRHRDGDKYAPQHAGYLITGVEHSGVYVDLAKSTAGNSQTEVFNFYDLDTIVSDYSIINCAKEQKFSSYRDFNGEVGCRFQGKYNTKDDYKLNGRIIDRTNIAEYYKDYIATQNYTVGDEEINIYYANRNDVAKVMNSVSGEYECAADSGKTSNGKRYKDHAGITKFCYSGSMTGDKQKSKHLFGAKSRKDIHGVAASRVFKVAATSKNYWLKSPLWYAARFGLGEVKGSVDPFSDSEKNISNYYEVTNMTKLRDGIAKMLDQINKTVHSSSGFSPVSAETKTGTLIYPSVYDPSIWSGNIYQATVSSVGGYNLADIYSNDSAASGFNAVSPDKRFVFTYDVTAPEEKRVVRFYSDSAGSSKNGAFSNLTCNIINQILHEGGTCSGSGDEGATATYDGQYYSLDDQYSKPFMNSFVRWVLGDHSYEGLDISENASKRLPLNGGGRASEGTPLRERKVDEKTHFVLADIINSTPTYFVDGDKGYLAVGANDGMLHFIDTSNMQPVLSYIPSAAWSHMKQLTSQAYDHYSFVDSTPQIYKRGDKTYVYGSFGLGLRGAYLMDVTGISSFASISDEKDKLKFAGNMLLWELTDKFKITDEIYAGSDYVGKYQEAPTLINAGGYKDNTKNTPYLIFTSGVNSVASSTSGKTPGVFIVNMLGELSENVSDINDKERCYVSNEFGEFNVPKTAAVVKSLKLPCVVASQELTDIQHVHNADIHAFSDPWNLGRTPDYTNVRLATVTGNDANAKGFYFGDSFGNLWRHPLGKTKHVNKPYNWFKKCDPSCSVAIAPTVMFVAKDSAGKNQPITVTPETGYYGGDGIAVAVGTGSYVYTYDSNVVSKVYNSSQSVYLLRDMGSVSAAYSGFTGRCGIGDTGTNANCLKPLYVSANLDQTTKKYSRSAVVNSDYKGVLNYGWYMDLIPVDPDTGSQIKNTGERINTNMLIIEDQLTITPNTPAVGDNCRGSGTSSLQQINYIAGTLSTKQEINALVTHLSATIHYDEKGIPSVVIHATVDNAEKKEGDEAIHSVELNQKVNPTRSSSWIRLF